MFAVLWPKNFFFPFPFSPFKLISIPNQKTCEFVKGLCANRNRHTVWKDARDGKQSSRKTNMAGVATHKTEPAEIKD